LGTISFQYTHTGTEHGGQVLISQPIPNFTGPFTITYGYASPTGVINNFRGIWRVGEFGSVCCSRAFSLGTADAVKTDNVTVGVPAGTDPGFWSCTNFVWFQWIYDSATQFAPAGSILSVSITSPQLGEPCEFGTQLKDAGELVVMLTPEIIGAALAALAMPELSVFLVPLAVGLWLSKEELCGKPPTTMPQLEPSDLLNPFPKLTAAISAIMWPALCECIPGTPPPTPFPPPTWSPPPGWPVQPTYNCDPADLCESIRQIYRRLDQINTALEQQWALVKLQQRYRLPFAYVTGATHPNLSGSGSFAVSRLLGVRVDVTTPPPSFVLEGNPPYWWDLGWMSVSDGGGMLLEKRVTRDVMEWLPEHMPMALQFGYFFKAGVTANVTELQAEPI
jgi:hypothetical protein